MLRRTLGRSGVEVSAIGFGCGPAAQLMVSDDRAAQVAAVRRALDRGISYFDTAAAYGWGRSEENLGRALRECDARPVVSTKVVVGVADLGDVRGCVLRSVEASLRRLQSDTVDLVILHNRVAARRDEERIVGVGPVLGLDDVLGSNGVAEGFRELVAAGTIRAGGFTAFGGERAAIGEVIGSGGFAVMNASYSLLNPSAALPVESVRFEENYREVIPAAEAAGIGVMCIRVLGSGELTGNAGGKALSGEDPATARVRSIASALGQGSAVAGAIRFALSTDGVSTVILGLSEVSHVDQAADAVAMGVLPPGEFALACAETAQLAAGRPGEAVGRTDAATARARRQAE